MTRSTALKVLNPILGLLFISQAATGILHDLLPHEVFEISHGVGGLLLVIAAVIHVILNWSWVKATFLKRKPKA